MKVSYFYQSMKSISECYPNVQVDVLIKNASLYHPIYMKYFIINQSYVKIDIVIKFS